MSYKKCLLAKNRLLYSSRRQYVMENMSDASVCRRIPERGQSMIASDTITGCKIS